MDRSFAISGTDQVTSAPPYTLLQSISEGSVTFGPSNASSSSWRKFIYKSTPTQQRGSETSVMVIPAAKTTTEGPIVLKSTPTPKELLSGPLFQVAGIFAIDEQVWADKHDEYLAETYLGNHADNR